MIAISLAELATARESSGYRVKNSCGFRLPHNYYNQLSFILYRFARYTHIFLIDLSRHVLCIRQLRCKGLST